MAIRLVIADDHPVVLKGLISFLQEHFDLVASCANGEECLKAIRTFEPDVALIDMHMPISNGLEILRTVTREMPCTRIVLLAASLSDREIDAAIDGGAFGVMLKESAPEALIDCVRSVAADHKWLPRSRANEAAVRARQRCEDATRLDDALTHREREVMRLVSDGLSNKEVGRKLNVAEGTVKVHLSSIYEKLGVNNRTTLANLARTYLDQRD
jgi:DNA-binding NarL/FixJ family response regulator